MSLSPYNTVPVDLGHRSYDIRIGRSVLLDVGAHIAPLLKRRRVAIVTDTHVAALHLKTLTDSLDTFDITYSAHILPAGEATKSFHNVERLCSELLDQAFERDDMLLAFGGGVIGDLTGFVASMYKRGCPFIQIPTTLLAQVDSSVGGKTAINTPHGKNLIGAFYQPAMVLADTSVLATLPLRDIKAGYAEVMKYGLLGDASFFEWLEANGAAVLAGNAKAQAYAIAASCTAKAQIVADDERERGRRALLNLGHTFGHALEAEGGYSGTLLHGEAVSAGMDMAFQYSVRRGLCDADQAGRVSAHLAVHDLVDFAAVPHALRQSPQTLLGHMQHDKKNSGGEMTLILARAIGDAVITRNVDQDDVLDFLHQICARATGEAPQHAASE